MNNIRSNAIRDEYMREYVDRTMKEIHDDVSTVFGPGAVDAYLIKNNQPYYTRDGLEVLESLVFDNELSEYVRKIIFQAAYRQGKKVGDGSTSLIVLYTNLYKRLRELITNGNLLEYPMDTIRKTWNNIIKLVIDQLVEDKQPLTKDNLLQMMYTCTQDLSLTEKLYNSIADAIMDQAYIIVNKSNIETDLTVTSYKKPMIKATRLFTVRPIRPVEENTVIFHCNGMLDLAHPEVLMALMHAKAQSGEFETMPCNIVILCNGITNTTRTTTKELVKMLREMDIVEQSTLEQYNNIAIYALDDYRSMNHDEIEDLSTMITEEKGIGGLVNDITFEALLYQAFTVESIIGHKIDTLSTYDMDIKFLDKMRIMFMRPFTVTFDDVEGMQLGKDLGPVAMERYETLRKEIEEEKSEVRQVRLNKRLRRMYGHFIELEVGSKLIKDSQRKFELILDVVLSAAEAARSGVLYYNSILRTIDVVHDQLIMEHYDSDLMKQLLNVLADALCNTFIDMCNAYYSTPILLDEQGEGIHDWRDFIEHSETKAFNLKRGSVIDDALPELDSDRPIEEIVEQVTINGEEVELHENIVEPFSIMKNILENSMIPIELAMARVFHVAGFMQNYI